MAYIEKLIDQVEDKKLSTEIATEVDRLKNGKQFGLVFEEHRPEVLVLEGKAISVGSLIADRTDLTRIWKVKAKKNKAFVCTLDDDRTKSCEISIQNAVAIKRIGEPIFPRLTEIGNVSKNESKACHVLIEADNYHALQLLEYSHRGQIDCIYIDPPYNSRSKDWKYNNDYVDADDAYKHSKWLSFMERRLKVAKNILNPDTGVLIATIDEHEVHHLGCLLEKTFPEASRQMVSIVINPKGVDQRGFSRVEEYAIFCFMPGASACQISDDLLTESIVKTTNKPRWAGLLRSGQGAQREDSPNLFYPIFIDPLNNRIVDTGAPLLNGQQPDFNLTKGPYPAVWPIRSDRSFGRWMLSPATLMQLTAKGYTKLGRKDEERNTYAIQYVFDKVEKQIESGQIAITGRDEQSGTVSLEYVSEQKRSPKTVWHRSEHDAGANGTGLLKKIFGESNVFPFSKSIYAVKDTLAAVVSNNKNAKILDFFAGSGTTLNAVNLLNASDGGTRQCILVTNNEVSAKESEMLLARGIVRGSPEWEGIGICRSITWPRNKYSILGHRNGEPLPSDYITGEYKSVKKPIEVTSLDFVDTKRIRKSKASLLSFLRSVGFGSDISKDSILPSWAITDKGKAMLLDHERIDEFISALENSDTAFQQIFWVADPGLSKTDETGIRKRLQQLTESLNCMSEERPVARPLAMGFEENLRYFKLDFIEDGEIETAIDYGPMIPTLWLVSGAKGRMPSVKDFNAGYLCEKDVAFAVLIDEKASAKFIRELKGRTPNKVFIVTESTDLFEKIRDEIAKISNIDKDTFVQLFKEYIENFQLNAEQEQK